jgi:hypothetical protein
MATFAILTAQACWDWTPPANLHGCGQLTLLHSDLCCLRGEGACNKASKSFCSWQTYNGSQNERHNWQPEWAQARVFVQQKFIDVINNQNCTNIPVSNV